MHLRKAQTGTHFLHTYSSALKARRSRPPLLTLGFDEHIFCSPTIVLLFFTALPPTYYVCLRARAVNGLQTGFGLKIM